MKNSLKILLVDDEPDALELLECLLINKKGIEVVGKAGHKNEAIEQMIHLKPDVIFQDIQMGETNGLEMVDEYRKHHFTGKIVFVTAHMKYAIDAIKKAAFDYLLKPVDLDELETLILRLMSENNFNSSIGISKTEKFKIPTRRGYSLVNTDDIVFCKAEKNYTTFKIKNVESITSSMNLGLVETKLPPNIFFRLSRSVIVNTNFLVSVNKGENSCLVKAFRRKYEFHISGKKIKELGDVL